MPAERCSLGNPPFVGAKLMSDDQRADIRFALGGVKKFGLLDFVAAWYLKAAGYAKPETPCAFVSTNSITQSEQTGVLWPVMLDMRIHIHFAHRTFQWCNEAKGVAAVHCIIVGFSQSEPSKRVIYDYLDIRGEPQVLVASNINLYLVERPCCRTAPNRCVPYPKLASATSLSTVGTTCSPQRKWKISSREPQAKPWF